MHAPTNAGSMSASALSSGVAWAVDSVALGWHEWWVGRCGRGLAEPMRVDLTGVFPGVGGRRTWGRLQGMGEARGEEALEGDADGESDEGREDGREAGREAWREGGREVGREARREGGWERGKEGGGEEKRDGPPPEGVPEAS